MIVLRLSPVRAGLCSLSIPKTRSAKTGKALQSIETFAKHMQACIPEFSASGELVSHDNGVIIGASVPACINA